MEITKQQADNLIAGAIRFLEDAHHYYYKNAASNEDAKIDDTICDALDALSELKAEA